MCLERLLPLRLLLPALAVLAGCRKSEPQQPQVVDCQEDFGCLIQRAERCQPGTALRREEYTVAGQRVQVLARYEVVGLVQLSLCHVRRSQLEPPLPPPPLDAGTEELLPGKRSRNSRLPLLPKVRPGEVPLPLAQCLYPEKEVAQVLRRLQQGTPTQQDLDACYPGEGDCEQLRTPLLKPRCVLGDCLAGRWTFTCEYEQNGRLQIEQCIGSRLSEENPHCFLSCKAGVFDLNCRDPVTGRSERPLLP